ncbi:MAG TPA: UDP-N-acetylglucosamine pyrophosphorylase [Acidobacteriota bacterium]|nr:UDP-N-acetylglucosamine pyrophosphorylase [Acidobacteriota bacterium]
MNLQPGLSSRVRTLIDRGVTISCPYSVQVDETVDAGKIAPGVVIHSGCRISGRTTSIGPGCELGAEAPVTLEDCQLGRKVSLKGGYFSGATFLDGAVMGSSAHVRPATLMEEETGGAHAVGFKQTIFLSFVTAGSLINFCDALMAGGTSRKHHSEIGSSYIHFNYTPHQDKATPSLIGDVPRGVFLDRPPIFLGGQGGLVGPSRIAYGTVIPAGAICRRDILEEGRIYDASAGLKSERAFIPGAYRGIHRIVLNNLIYIGNLWALRAWYQLVRSRTMSGDPFSAACHEGALKRIEEGLQERIKRMRELAGKMHDSLKHMREGKTGELSPEIERQQQALAGGWPEIEEILIAGPPAAAGIENRDVFMRAWKKVDTSSGHIKALAALDPADRKAGAGWLQEIVNSAAVLWQKRYK